jgi:NarL family two-component system response regulator LiaR
MTSTVAEQIRVCVADDHAVVRQGLNAFLSSQPDIIVVGEAATGEELLRIAAREQPHVALVDLLMPGIGGIETTRLLRQAHPETQVIVLTSSTAQAHVIRALRAGALSYVFHRRTDRNGDPPSCARATHHRPRDQSISPQTQQAR